MTYSFKNIYLNDSATVVGLVEAKGPLKDYFDSTFYNKKLTFEENEIETSYKAIDILLEKTNTLITDYSLALSTDLSNQNAISSYLFRRYNIPNISYYGACSGFSLGIGLSCLLIKGGIKNIILSISSNNKTSERQFRNPIEYGGDKEYTQTFTSTGSSCCVISKKKSKIRISYLTLGKIVDFDYKIVSNFGTSMAPSAIETLFTHFKNTNTTPNDYDLIVTGDLGKIGYNIVLKALRDKYGKIENYNDCGLMLYDTNKQKVFSGGSGPSCSSLVFLAYIKKRMLEGYLKKVLVASTGALMSPTMVNQKNSIPSVCHAVVFEVEDK